MNNKLIGEIMRVTIQTLYCADIDIFVKAFGPESAWYLWEKFEEKEGPSDFICYLDMYNLEKLVAYTLSENPILRLQEGIDIADGLMRHAIAQATGGAE